jgi:hypothetical protein
MAGSEGEIEIKKLGFPKFDKSELFFGGKQRFTTLTRFPLKFKILDEK